MNPDSRLAVAALFLVCNVVMAREKTVDGNGQGGFAAGVPEFTLKDPLGNGHGSASLYNQTGMLIMLTVPNLTQYEKMQAWDSYMAKQPWPKQNAPKRVLLEDLSQQVAYKEKVRGLMKASYQPGGDTIVIVDEDGNIRRRFGIMNNETVILLVDASGHVVHHEADDVEPDFNAARRLSRQVCQLAALPAPMQVHPSVIMASVQTGK